MSKPLPKETVRRHPAVMQAEARAAAGFKPVALPALAAAVTGLGPRRKAARPVALREIPAILRQDALID